MKNILSRRPIQLVWLLICLWVSHNGFSQRTIANQINQIKGKTTPKRYRPFSTPFSSARIAADTAFVEGATVHRFLMNKPEVGQLQLDNSNFIEISLPVSATKNIDLELVPYTIFGKNFKVLNAKNEVVEPQNLGKFYQGIVKGDNQSTASVSIIDGKISGIISQKAGNFNLGLEGDSGNYILFNEQDLKQKSNFTCATDEMPVRMMGQNLVKETPATSSLASNVACGSVEIYLEADSALFGQQGGSIANTVNYINSVFSKVATLYSNEGLSVVISEIKVWNTTDPYVGYTSTGNVLSAFRSTIGTSFNGRLAHFLSGRNLGGGVAYIDVLCAKSYGHGVSANLNTYNPNLPTYSWNVEVITHELGHNFGSPHTQSCSWPGGALDNCYATEEGCPLGPAPTNGGTIMSYCHLTSTGINFANGFGMYPGNLIRSRTQACLGSAVEPSNLAVLEVYNTQVLVSWTHTTGLYSVEYRQVGAGAWSSAGTSGNKNRTISSLTPNTAYEWRVNANCSDFVTGTFTTNNTPSPGTYCIPTHTNGCTYGILITSVLLGGTTLSSNSDCASGGYSFITSPVKSLTLGQSNSFTVSLEGYYNPAQIAIWIDLNKDAQFQANERLFTTTSARTQAITGTITVPAGSSIGQTRMRITVNFSSAPTNPCGTYTYGETEDYYVNLVCPAPTAHTVTGGGSFCSGGTGVAVGLSGSQTGVSYQLKRDNTNVGAAITGTGNALAFGNQTVAGSYTVWATPSGCTATAMTGSVSVSVTANPTLVAGVAVNATTCGGANGSIPFTTTNVPNGNYQLSYTGAGSPKTVTVSNNAFSLTGLSVGTYSNFSMAVNGCTASDATSKTVNNPPSPVLTSGAITNATVCGASDGNIAFSTSFVTSGTYQLSYTGAGSPKTVTVSNNAFLLTGLSAGTYSNFSITSNNCTGSDATSKTVAHSIVPTLAAGVTVNATTCGGTNGSIPFTTTNVPNGNYQLSYTGAGSPKTVTVNNNSFSLTGLSIGTYSNFSMAVNGCTASDATSKTVNNPPSPVLTSGAITNATVCGASDGSIAFSTSFVTSGTYQLSYTGAGSPKTVTVSNNAFLLTGLSAGTYSNFSITSNNCTGSDATSKTVAHSIVPTLAAGVTVNATTCGGANGSIPFTTTNVPNGNYQLSYTGAGSPKAVTVSNNAFSLTGLSVGTYSNFSMAVNGCTASDATSKTVNNPPSPVLTSGAITNATVCGASDGSIAFSTSFVTSGTYQLSYTGAGSPKTVTVSNNAFLLTGLSAGTYSNFSITSNNCTGSDATSKTVAHSLVPTLAAGTVTPSATCGGTDGAIAFTTTNIPSGNYQLSYTGTGSPKTVAIANNSFTLTNVPAGVYSNFAIVVNGCTALDPTSKTVNTPASIGLMINTVTNPTTCGGTNGSIAFTTTNIPSGNYQLSFVGTGSPKTVSIANNALTLANLSAGTYKNFSISFNSCVALDTTTQKLVEPTPPNAGSISGALVLCAGVPSALISNGVAGGTWSSATPSVAAIHPTSGVVTGSSAGSSLITYTVTANGCSASTTATVTVDVASAGGNLAGSGAVCTGINSSVLTLSGYTGTLQKWQWSLTPDFSSATDVFIASTSVTTQNLTQTMYYRVIVKNGVCEAVSSPTATITVNPLPTVGFSGSASILVGNTTTVFPVTGGTWISNSSVKASVTNAGLVTGLEAGTATFTFTDTTTGCKNTTPTLVVTNISNSPCNQVVTLVSPADDIATGSVLKQSNNSISAANRVTGTTTTVTYQSGTSVTLQPGFQAEAGTVFKAQIGGCN
ncbi:GEVED domain-containing protein [Runella sp. SP2]|uniref:GEVED domain-containing protein n=1 Tax=Runella sp. SP2 TaxID=2268026 RepID=UPI000F075896|nr:GEVED domain-containing protein [Runella sp. SP2]AYQ33760.1 hypothetical protein DTQ70_17070 [Runella sp. SP2]